MPKNTTNARVKAIENFGAAVIVTKENYDGTLRIAIDEAKKNTRIKHGRVIQLFLI